MEVKKKDGSEFPGATLYQIVIALQFHLETQGFEWKLLDDPVFICFKNTLDNIMKERAKMGLGCTVSATPITLTQEEKMWQEGMLGEDTPDVLCNTVVYLVGLNFALHGGQEQRNLRAPGFNPQITIQSDEFGLKYLHYKEDFLSKTNQGGLANRRGTPKEAKVYGSDNPLRNVVCLYEKYVNLLPANARHPSLYKYTLKRPKPNQWYSDNQLGQNALAKIIKTLCDKAGLTGEKFCNHSLRATCATRMYQAGVDEQLIQTFTGHASKVVHKYKTTNDQLLKSANKTVSGNQYIVPKPAPSATVSVAPESECAKIEPLINPDEPSSVIAKKSVCQYLKTSGCEGMCNVLQKVQEEVDKKRVKCLKLSLKYRKGDKKWGQLATVECVACSDISALRFMTSMFIVHCSMLHVWSSNKSSLFSRVHQMVCQKSRRRYLLRTHRK